MGYENTPYLSNLVDDKNLLFAPTCMSSWVRSWPIVVRVLLLLGALALRIDGGLLNMMSPPLTL